MRSSGILAVALGVQGVACGGDDISISSPDAEGDVSRVPDGADGARVDDVAGEKPATADVSREEPSLADASSGDVSMVARFGCGVFTSAQSPTAMVAT